MAQYLQLYSLLKSLFHSLYSNTQLANLKQKGYIILYIRNNISIYSAYIPSVIPGIRIPVFGVTSLNGPRTVPLDERTVIE